MNIKFALAVSVFCLASPSADAITVSTTLPGNDCAGTFGGQMGTDCIVIGPTGTQFSPLIAKFDVPDPSTDPLIFSNGVFGIIDG